MKKGFTLVELLAVIVILAIVLVMALPNIINIITKTEKDALDIDATNIAKNLESRLLSGEIDIASFAKEDLESIGVNSRLYDGFGVSIVDDKVVVTLAKEDYIGENKLDSKVYGVKFDGINSTLTRTDDSKGLTTTVTETNIISDFDSAEIYSEFSEEVDIYGNVFIKIPKFWIKKTKKGKVWTYQISRTKQDINYYLPACFYDESSGKIVPYVLVGKYEASLEAGTNRFESKTGKYPFQEYGKRITDFRGYARNNNTGDQKGYQLIDIHIIDILQTLFYVEFATLDGQSIMKGDVFNGPRNTGGTDHVGTSLSTGSDISNTIGIYSMKYRGIENIWGNTRTAVDGINIKHDHQKINQVYVARDATLYESNRYRGAYVNLSYKNPDTIFDPASYTSIGVEGKVLEMGFDSVNPFIQMPISLTDSDSPYGAIYQVNMETADPSTPWYEEPFIYFGGAFYDAEQGLSTWRIISNPGLDPFCSSRLVKVPI